jgi:2-succinyl-5-enolpyruvyl-6-hydroxy-3-cyclohexene-1-carboxylate synthase
MNNTTQPKDLSKEAPRSPYEQMGGFAIIARTIDKCRAVIAGTPGEYHFNCPLDKMLFGFKEIDAEEFKAYVTEGHTDEEITEWVKTHGAEKTEDEVKAWSESFRSDFSYSTNEWFIGECQRLGLDPEKTTLFDMLEVDDTTSFAQ